MPIRCRVVKGMNDFDGSWTVRIPTFPFTERNWLTTL